MEVSVIVPIYNHEKYLEYAIKSILEQKVNFEYEVLIGEDCSTDNSRAVLKKLEPSLPSSFKIFYREKNMCGKNSKDLRMRAQGKYLCVLEGDDYWCNPDKLQMQYDFLETHPDYIAVAHNVNVIGDDNEPVKYKYPECKKKEFTYKEFEKGLLLGQTATIMCRNYYKMPQIDTMLDVGPFTPGDRVKNFLLVSYGKVRCIQERMSNYRYVLTHGSSYSATHDSKSYGDLSYSRGIYEYSKNHDINPKMKITVEKMYAWGLLKYYIRKHDAGIKKDLKKVLDASPNRTGLYLYFLKCIFRIPLNKLKLCIDKKQKDAIRKKERERMLKSQQ